MLVDFSFKNYKSYKNTQLFTMRKDKGVKSNKPAILSSLTPKEGLNRVVAFYGPNASGKTNLLEAIIFLRTLVGFADEKNIIPTFFNNNEVSDFFIHYIFGGKKYNYYLSIEKDTVVSEKLIIYKSQKPTIIYSFNSNSQFVVNNIKDEDEKKAIAYNFKNNQHRPILSYLSNSKDPDIKNALLFFIEGIRPNNTRASIELVSNKYESIIKENNNITPIIDSLISSADFGIDSIAMLENLDSMSKDQRRVLLKAFLQVDELGDKRFSEKDKEMIWKEFEKDNDNKQMYFQHRSGGSSISLKTIEESRGTIAASNILIDLINVLKNGKVYIVDELDCSLHPSITSQIIEVFNDPFTNPNNAQIIFSTHDLSLLDSSIHKKDLMDRDQIWLTEKSPNGESSAYPLTDIANVPRLTDNLYKSYIMGRFGAAPRASIYYEIQKFWNDYNES